ncbi:MAG: hypothetical protein WC191_04165 [Proteiniphilum sp.]|jgi:hypothetical protein|nr:hypothetical protein [Proteiniphilum sp.]HHT35207.1 DUF3185 domain-containing protein [Bacteroidales bacterium]MDD3978826.1 hypothetical protein [Proteiniphilum sp.]MDD5345325.1 hypothetical protein [Proteiniphilum sp.]MDD5619247.1 hypothetical protein [Proteiniphilum sp.]
MKKVIGILLIVAALVLGYLGVTGISQSEKSVDLLGLEITAEDNNAKQTAYIELALGVVALAGGVYLLGQKKS